MAHVLVVDDSPTDLHAIRSVLEAKGYKVSAVNSGEDGIAKARELRPDLILMDVVMPGISGFQAVRRITRDPVTAAIPVVFVSAKHEMADRAWGMRQGARDYLGKPFTEEDLLAVVQRNLHDAA